MSSMELYNHNQDFCSIPSRKVHSSIIVALFMKTSLFQLAIEARVLLLKVLEIVVSQSKLHCINIKDT